MTRDTPPNPPRESRPLVVVHGDLHTPPMSAKARKDAGEAMRLLQDGVPVGMPARRPMRGIGEGCCELRIDDTENDVSWRILCYVDEEVVLVLEVFKKKTEKTPESVKRSCRERLVLYRRARAGAREHGR